MSSITKRAGKRVATTVAMVGTVFTMGFLLAGPASAEPATPADPVLGAFDGLETKITLYGAAIVALVVLSVALFLGIKYLRRGATKA